MRHVPPIFWYALMPLAALADVAENCLHLAITAPQATPAPWWFLAAGVAASAKFVLMALFALTALARGWQLRSRS
jgi:hypothetical protein